MIAILEIDDKSPLFEYIEIVNNGDYNMTLDDYAIEISNSDNSASYDLVIPDGIEMQLCDFARIALPEGALSDFGDGTAYMYNNFGGLSDVIAIPEYDRQGGGSASNSWDGWGLCSASDFEQVASVEYDFCSNVMDSKGCNDSNHRPLVPTYADLEGSEPAYYEYGEIKTPSSGSQSGENVDGAVISEYFDEIAIDVSEDQIPTASPTPSQAPDMVASSPLGNSSGNGIGSKTPKIEFASIRDVSGNGNGLIERISIINMADASTVLDDYTLHLGGSSGKNLAIPDGVRLERCESVRIDLQPRSLSGNPGDLMMHDHDDRLIDTMSIPYHSVLNGIDFESSSDYADKCGISASFGNVEFDFCADLIPAEECATDYYGEYMLPTKYEITDYTGVVIESRHWDYASYDDYDIPTADEKDEIIRELREEIGVLRSVLSQLFDYLDMSRDLAGSHLDDDYFENNRQILGKY